MILITPFSGKDYRQKENLKFDNKSFLLNKNVKTDSFKSSKIAFASVNAVVVDLLPGPPPDYEQAFIAALINTRAALDIKQRLLLPIDEFCALCKGIVGEVGRVHEPIQQVNIIRHRFATLEDVTNIDSSIPEGPYRNFQSDRAHELNNVLEAISMELEFSDFLSEPISTDYCKKSIKLIKILFNIAKRYNKFLEEGLYHNNLQPDRVFTMALEPARELARQKRTRIDTTGKDVLGEFPEGISTSIGRLNDYDWYMIVSNLVQNAVKYSPDESTVKITLAQMLKGDKNYLKLSVKDKGIGIPPGEQPLVLKSSRGSNVGDIPGTGYGLTRVRKILLSMNSDISIESPLDIENLHFPGTKITTLIPLAEGS